MPHNLSPAQIWSFWGLFNPEHYLASFKCLGPELVGIPQTYSILLTFRDINDYYFNFRVWVHRKLCYCKLIFRLRSGSSRYYVWMYTRHRTFVELRGQLLAVRSLLPPCRCQELNSDCQVWYKCFYTLGHLPRHRGSYYTCYKRHKTRIYVLYLDALWH